MILALNDEIRGRIIMDTIERLINTDDLITSRLIRNLDREQGKFMYYDPVSDILLLTITPPTTESVVHYIDDHVALLYEPESLEVVGFQVEAFEHSFMPEHETLKAVWRLSDANVALENIGDLIMVFERKKQIVAQELKNITRNLLSGSSRRLIPA